MTDNIDAPTWFLAICDTCHSIQTFTSEHARDQWEKHHPHQENYPE